MSRVVHTSPLPRYHSIPFRTVRYAMFSLYSPRRLSVLCDSCATLRFFASNTSPKPHPYPHPHPHPHPNPSSNRTYSTSLPVLSSSSSSSSSPSSSSISSSVPISVPLQFQSRWETIHPNNTKPPTNYSLPLQPYDSPAFSAYNSNSNSYSRPVRRWNNEIKNRDRNQRRQVDKSKLTRSTPSVVSSPAVPIYRPTPRPSFPIQPLDPAAVYLDPGFPTFAAPPPSSLAESQSSSPPASSSSYIPFHFDLFVNSLETFQSFQRAFRNSHGQFISHPEIPPSERTVVVAVSGGIDSAMTAQLLVHLGLYKRVVAVHMRNWDEIEESGHCNGEKDAKDAAAICQALNIPLEVVDYSREYFNDVFQDLLEGYSKGDTPSPDVLCNRVIKFQLLLDHVRAKYGQHAVLATGHYARVRQIHAETVTATIPAASTSFPSSSPSTSSFSVVPSASSAQLYIGLDPRKDQSYFLSSVPSHALMSCLCPLGWIQKSFLKQIASKWEVIIQNGPNEPIPNVTLTTAQQIQQQQKNDDQPTSPFLVFPICA